MVKLSLVHSGGALESVGESFLPHSPFKNDGGLADPEAALMEEMLIAYRTRRMGALRHTAKTVSRDIQIIRDFQVFAGCPPWRWSEELFDQWNEHLGLDRKLAVASQRHYQIAIKCFLDYVSTNTKFTNESLRRFGYSLVQICHKGNLIPHIVDRELESRRRALTHDELSKLMNGLDEDICEAHRFHGKDLRPLQRDKVLFFTIYILGLRASEALKLNIESFEPNPEIPALRNYGFASVWGKGSNGSGPRHRIVPVDNPQLPPLLKWYMEKVRPLLMGRADANEKAIFLSERGKRMAISTLEARFQRAIDHAGLGGLNLTPHSLRHSSVTHGAMEGRSLEVLRRKHGHVYAATTQQYCHIPDYFIKKQVSEYVNRKLENII